MIKKTKKQYIEMNTTDWDAVLFSIILFPLILLVGLTLFVFNFIRYNLKLVIYLIICFIPVLNSGIILIDTYNFFESFDKFEIENIFQNLKTIKRFEVKK